MQVVIWTKFLIMAVDHHHKKYTGICGGGGGIWEPQYS